MPSKKNLPCINATICPEIKHGPKSHQRILENAEALQKFLFNIYSANQMCAAESDRKIGNSIIRIYRSGFFCAQGILLTENGYFATAKHCIIGNGASRFNLTIKTSEGNDGVFEKVCAYSTIDDIAIGKAKIDGPCEPLIYKINALRTWQGNLIAFRESHYLEDKIIQKGKVMPLSNQDIVTEDDKYSGHLIVDMISQAGFSGSPILNSDSMLMGLTSTYNNRENTTSFVKSYRILELVSMYSLYLKEI